jgi:hypothetical protein
MLVSKKRYVPRSLRLAALFTTGLFGAWMNQQRNFLCHHQPREQSSSAAISCASSCL